MIIFYFTSTGNNLYIAKKIGGQLYSIPKLLKEGQFEFTDDKIGIIFPCYYLGAPRIVKEFIEKVKLKSSYIFAIMSYGSMSCAGTNHFLKIAKNCGINLSYINDIIMVDNYLPMFDQAAQIKNSANKNIETNLAKIISDIHSGKIYIKKHNLINNLLTYLGQIYYKINIKNADSRLIVEDSCNSCKICERVCPVNNIKVNGKPTFLHQCEECFACTHHCPKNAIRVAHEKSKVRFINQNVSLKEIIEAND